MKDFNNSGQLMFVDLVMDRLWYVYENQVIFNLVDSVRLKFPAVSHVWGTVNRGLRCQ